MHDNVDIKVVTNGSLQYVRADDKKKRQLVFDKQIKLECKMKLEG